MEAKTTIKVEVELRDRMARLAAEGGVSMVDLLRQMVERVETEQFFAQMEADLTRLRDEDREEWEAYRRESRDWYEATSADGLEAS